MGEPEISKVIMGSMKQMGYLAPGGDDHNSEADSINKELTAKQAMGNYGPLDIDRPKPPNQNPGVDKGFLNKGNPQQDTTGHGTLTMKTRQ